MLNIEELFSIEILTGILVLITGFYAWATYRILKANERVIEVMHVQSEAMTRPYVTVSPVLEPDNPLFYLRIKNTGKTPAINLKLTIDKSFYRYGENVDSEDISKFKAFNETITSLHPNSEIFFSLALSHVILGNNASKELTPLEFTITAEYSFDEKTVKENNIIDLRPYTDANQPQDAYVRKLKDISDSIKKISK